MQGCFLKVSEINARECPQLLFSWWGFQLYNPHPPLQPAACCLPVLPAVLCSASLPGACCPSPPPPGTGPGAATGTATGTGTCPPTVTPKPCITSSSVTFQCTFDFAYPSFSSQHHSPLDTNDVFLLHLDIGSADALHLDFKPVLNPRNPHFCADNPSHSGRLSSKRSTISKIPSLPPSSGTLGKRKLSDGEVQANLKKTMAVSDSLPPNPAARTPHRHVSHC